MIRIFTLFALFTSLVTSVSAQNRTYTDNGTNTAYTLYAGDSLIIASGTFTGSINSWEKDATIYVAPNADFKPGNFSYFQGTIHVVGNATLSTLNGQSDKFVLRNSGRVVVNGSAYLGNKATLQNTFGATIEFKAGLNTNNVTFSNTGNIAVTGSWYLGNNSTLNNLSTINVTDKIEFNASQITNVGSMQSGGQFIVSQGQITNNCKMVAGNKFEINGTTVLNNGLIWVKATGSTPILSNGGTIEGTAASRVKAVNLENNGTIKGSGYYYFTGTTTNNSAGKIGTNSNNGDQIFVNDITRTNANNIFDNQYGTIYSNVSFLDFAAPDTLSAGIPCGLPSESLLPVKWDYFTVNVSNNIPTLRWAADYDPHTTFIVERSYDNRTYSTLHTLVVTNTRSSFSYNDDNVNTQASVVFYRIRAIEPTGEQKISETRTARFANTTGLKIQASPNPFTNQFSISFQASQRENLTVRVYNLSGQQQFISNITVSNGYNSIMLKEAASLPRGMYFVQLLNETGVVGMEKVIKQ